MSVDKFLEILSKPGFNHDSFFHFTDTRNLPGIREHGLLSMRELKRRGFVPPAPGGNEHSLVADEMFGMDAYVHLCMLDQHPMEYLARQDGRIRESLFLKINPEILRLPGVMMTADVSNKSGVVPQLPADILGKLDLQVIYGRTEWKDPAVQVRRRAAKKYEILIPTQIPVELILNLPNG